MGRIADKALGIKKGSTSPKSAPRGTLRAGTIHKAINPATGRIISVKTAKKKAWTAIARYVRKLEPICCTCPNPTTEAGHYQHNSDKENKQLGGNELWYYEKNIHGQCGTCNRWKSGNLAPYSLFMEEKYGHGILQEIRDLYHTPRKWTIGEILFIEEVYKQKLHALS